MNQARRGANFGRPHVLVVHETGGQKYFEAITWLGERGQIDGPRYYEFRVVRLLLSQLLKQRLPVLPVLGQSLKNILFRLRVPFVRGHMIVLGMAPLDIRLVWYRLLARRNAVIYHTSWTDWAVRAVPHRYGPFTPFLRRIWLQFLSHPHVRVVAVTPAVAAGLKSVTGIDAVTIPHVVSDAFFDVQSDISVSPIGLLFVGQLLPQKGVRLLTAILERAGQDVTLGIVGDGPCRDEIVAAAATNSQIRYYGPVADRAQLAAIIARHHILLVPSLRTPKWQELFGMVIPEAMAAGLVVIASDHVGPRTILAEGGGIMVQEGDVEAVAAHIARLQDDPALWKQLSSTARRIAREYSVSELAGRWQRIFESAPDAPDGEKR
jgi:glycosyltransferase involved in cell wall biosynthesis